MKTCPICGGEVLKPMIKYCSVTCRNRNDYLVKRERNPDAIREKNRKSHSKEEYKENEKKRKLKQLEWALSVGIKHSQLRLYGYTFLKENPEVIETLKVMNTKIKQSDEEAALVKKKWYDNHKEKVKKYQREYKIKNADVIKEKAKQWREANQERIKEYRKKYKENNLVI